MASDFSIDRLDLVQIQKRVRDKIKDHVRYDFTPQQNNLLKSFFDLVQEYEGLDDFFRICVVVLFESMQVESALYLLDKDEKQLKMVCSSQEGVIREPRPVPTGIYLSDEPYEADNSYIVPIYKKPPKKIQEFDDLLVSDDQSWQKDVRILGMLEIFPFEKLNESDLFFLGKYANRIGFRLHNRLLAHQNVHHLKFINSLVMDIEHNVIIPNMYFRHLFNQLRRKIGEMWELELEMTDISKKLNVGDDTCNQLIGKLGGLREDLMGYQQEMMKHHANVSLFLESLFRREHFERGHLVLRPKPCRVEKEIILPQLGQYKSRLKANKITIDRPTGMDEEEIPIMVDKGLLAQVYANLFSNAVKYTEEIFDHMGCTRKALAYGREIINDYFGPNQRGVKFNVFTTGSHLTQKESEIVFSEGFRGANSQDKPGTGHGLSFIKHVIELHGGQVGYEATGEGNNFYFVIPLPSVKFLQPWPDNDLSGQDA
ncbi:MAG: HAMP domain-containing histidine kinase [Deltaproteobacteria bacterium]|jgi:signal transduction histidine kinase|nr:HAMP domain-containing histidine kinase [Deltaproteobacteria bacterium]